ncbi:MAG: hypothetical protein ACLU9Y_09035 [Thomasclavelia ramosa]
MNKIQKQYKINEKLTKLSAKKMFEECGCIIEKELLEAINQQMRELGWL